VPIWWQGSGVIETTYEDWRGAISAAHDLPYAPHLEIETYTWDVIPIEERAHMEGGDLTESIYAEYRALLQEIRRET
jgi:hypothetical protein